MPVSRRFGMGQLPGTDASNVKVFSPGKLCTSLDEVLKGANVGRWLMLRGVPKHPSVIVSMTLRTVDLFIRKGELRWAKRNPD